MKKYNEQKHADALAKRAALRDLSNQLKKLADMGAIPPSEDGTVNGLLRFYYAKAGAADLKTFGEWKKLGYRIRKGAHALLLWGKPRKAKSKESTPAEDEETEQEKRDDFFPVAYMFAAADVIKL